MDSVLIYEIIGYVASVLVAISLMMSNIIQLRIVNMIGAATFSVYGLLISSWPVAGMNAFIVGINIYYLLQMYRTEEYFRILELNGDHSFLNYFLGFHESEIKKIVPDFNTAEPGGEFRIFILRNTVPAGVLIGDKDDAGNLRLHLDFVTPAYRDFKIARYLFGENKAFFASKGVKAIETKTEDPVYRKKLMEMGFSVAGNNQLKLDLS
ncbi:MAG: hypothetical protein LAT67_06650 [Balneolales bacterium]|nr:hypothetical protein [Balneolales bacterium]